jgi:hypothetical protein
MPHHKQQTIILGDLIAAAFDSAVFVTSSPQAAARLAADKVARRLTRARRFDLQRRLRDDLPAIRRQPAAVVAHARAA